jgi:hypothetical protein
MSRTAGKHRGACKQAKPWLLEAVEKLKRASRLFCCEAYLHTPLGKRGSERELALPEGIKLTP